jgi:hypothetical protein
MRLWIFVAAAIEAGCSVHGAVETQESRLGDLAYSVPAGWTHHDGQTRTRTSSEWTPPSNDRKESVDVITTQISPALAKAGPSAIEDLLRQAQTGFGSTAKISLASRLTSPSGFVGAQIEVEFVPPSVGRTYHRMHGVFLDGDRLINVLYTAVDPDFDTFAIVVNSLHHGEG